IEVDPKYSPAYHSLGNALRDQSKSDEAIAAYNKAIEFNGNNASVRNNLGVTLWWQGKQEDAIKAFRGAIEGDPKYMGLTATSAVPWRYRGNSRRPSPATTPRSKRTQAILTPAWGWPGCSQPVPIPSSAIRAWRLSTPRRQLSCNRDLQWPGKRWA